MRCPWSAQTAQPRVKTDRKSALVSIDPRLEISSSCASQAENAGSIPVARSKDFGAEPNDYKGFRLTSRVHRVPTMSRVTRPLAPTKRPKYLQTGCRH